MPKSSDSRHAIYLYEDSRSAQFRYRVWNPSEACKKNSKKWQVIAFSKKEISELRKVLSGAELLIIERQTAKNSTIPNLIKEAKSLGLKVVFDIDDLVFDYKHLKLISRTTNEKNLLYWVGYIWGVRRIAKRADAFLATNGFLAKKLNESFGKPVAIIPNSLSDEQVKISETICRNKKPHNGFKVGYFSGSPTHAKDLHLIESSITQFLEEHHDAKLKIVGYMSFSSSIQELINGGRVEYKKPVDYSKLQEEIASVDVNLAPLVVNDFTNCKSELKYFESAIVEVATIASPTFAFKNAIKDGETGFIAEPNEWLKKLEYLYGHPEENHKIAKRAKDYCLKNYYGAKYLQQIEEAYDAISK